MCKRGKQTCARLRNCAALSTIEEKKWVKWGPSRVWWTQRPSAHSHTWSCSLTTNCSVPPPNSKSSFVASFKSKTHSKVSSETWTQRTTSSADSHTCYIISLQGHRTFTLSFVVSSTVFCSSLCFWTVFLIIPLRWSLTCHCYLRPLPRGSWGSRGKEYRDKSRLWKRRRRASPRLYLCNKPLFYSLLQPSFYPFSHVKPNHPPKNYQLIPALLSHDDNRLYSWETPKHLTSFSSPVRAGVLLWDA